MVNVGFFGKPVPLAGQRRKPSAPIAHARAPWPVLDRLSSGRHLQTNWMRNRCENVVQYGATTLYVVDNFGDLVPVQSWGDQC